MKVLVAVKRVIDYNVRIRVKADLSGVETQNVKMSMNPFDEIAVEEAVRLKEQGQASEVVVVSIGPNQSQETLRTALAMGADRAILLQTNETFEPLNIAKLLQKIVEKEQPRLAILGKQGVDNDCNQTGQILAGLLNWTQATFASKLLIQSSQHIDVTREVDGGLETIQVDLPCVITTDLRLNDPRYISLPNIMKAKSKPLEIIDIDQLGLSLESHTKILKIEPPPPRKSGVVVADANELVDKLKNEAKVI